MIFDKTIAYDINPISLPRLYSKEDKFGLDNILVRKIDESTGVVRFTELLDLANSNNYSVLEADNKVCTKYDLDCIYIVNEAKLYVNPFYRQAVFKYYKTLPIQLETVGIDEVFYNILEQCIEEDIENDSTDYTDYILYEGIDSLNDINRAATDTANDASDAVQSGKGVVDKVVGKVQSWFGKKVVSGIDNALNNQETIDKVTRSAGEFGKNATKGVIQGVTKGARDEAGHYVRKAAVATAAIGALAIMNRQVKNLTNNENINTKDPGKIAKTMNSLKRIWVNLTQRQKVAPPQQQGIIARLIEKIKKAIRWLGRKLGLSHGS